MDKTGGDSQATTATPRVRKPREPRPDTTTFAGFVGKVKTVMAERLGSREAADNVCDDPAFAVVFRTCFDIRKSVGNPVNRAAETLVNILAEQRVKDRMAVATTRADQ